MLTVAWEGWRSAAPGFRNLQSGHQSQANSCANRESRSERERERSGREGEVRGGGRFVGFLLCVRAEERGAEERIQGMGEGDGEGGVTGGVAIPGPRIYSCCNCRCHVADHDEIISKCFQGRNGRAYLFTNVVNVTVGAKEDRHLMTGLHTVADINCFQCSEVLGWKYEKAYEESQKYKEGKYILEKARVMKENW